MKQLLILAVFLFTVIGCSSTPSKEISLSGKTVGEIRALYKVDEDSLLSSGDPPCVLNAIGFQIGDSDYFLNLGVYGVDYKLRFNVKKPCGWDFSDFATVIPDEIYLEKIGSNKRFKFDSTLAPLPK